MTFDQHDFGNNQDIFKLKDAKSASRVTNERFENKNPAVRGTAR
jgi:hypothetical protein